MVRPDRVELPTFWFVARRSIQLSYGRTRIIDLHQQAGLAYSTFQRRDSASFQRIQLGLKARRNIGDAVDESGAIIAADADEGTPDLG